MATQGHNSDTRGLATSGGPLRLPMTLVILGCLMAASETTTDTCVTKLHGPGQPTSAAELITDWGVPSHRHNTPAQLQMYISHECSLNNTGGALTVPPHCAG